MPKINCHGLDIEIHRSVRQSGKLVIDIATHDLDEGDTYENGVPQLIVYLSEERLETTPDGGWRIGHATSHDDDGDVHIVPPRSSFVPPSERPDDDDDEDDN